MDYMNKIDSQLIELYGLAEQAEKEGKIDEAIQLYEVAGESGHPLALVKLAEYYKKGNYTDIADEYYKKAEILIQELENKENNDTKNISLVGLSTSEKANICDKCNNFFDMKNTIKNNTYSKSYTNKNKKIVNFYSLAPVSSKIKIIGDAIWYISIILSFILFFIFFILVLADLGVYWYLLILIFIFLINGYISKYLLIGFSLIVKNNEF